MALDRRPYFVTRACDEDQHEFGVRNDGERYCTVCKFSVDSLREVLDQEI